MHIQVSQDFRKKAKDAVSSIIVFIFVYFLIFLFTVVLALACIAGGIWLIAAKPMFLTLMIGIGLAATGLFVFYFIIKFLFKIFGSTIDRRGPMSSSISQWKR